MGLNVHPVLKKIPGTEHYVAELPDEELAKNGLTTRVVAYSETETVVTTAEPAKKGDA